MAILSVEQLPVAAHDITFGVTSSVTCLLSVYVGMSALENSIAEKPVMYIGQELVSVDRLRRMLMREKTGDG